MSSALSSISKWTVDFFSNFIHSNYLKEAKDITKMPWDPIWLKRMRWNAMAALPASCQGQVCQDETCHCGTVLKCFTPHWRDFGCAFAFNLLFPWLVRLMRTGSKHQQSSAFCSEDQHVLDCDQVTNSLSWGNTTSCRHPLATVAATGKLDMEV